MNSWLIGKVKISCIVEIVLPVAYYKKYPFMREATPQALQEIPWLYPDFVSPDGVLQLSIHALLVEAPGLCLLVDTCIGNDKPRKITGDTMHHPCQIARPDWSVTFDEDQAAAASCRKSLLEDVADSSVLVIGTHFASPTAGKIIRDGDTYKFVS